MPIIQKHACGEIVHLSNEDNKRGNLYFGVAKFYYSRDPTTGEIITLADPGTEEKTKRPQ